MESNRAGIPDGPISKERKQHHEIQQEIGPRHCYFSTVGSCIDDQNEAQSGRVESEILDLSRYLSAAPLNFLMTVALSVIPHHSLPSKNKSPGSQRSCARDLAPLLPPRSSPTICKQVTTLSSSTFFLLQSGRFRTSPVDSGHLRHPLVDSLWEHLPHHPLHLPQPLAEFLHGRISHNRPYHHRPPLQLRPELRPSVDDPPMVLILTLRPAKSNPQ